MKLSRYLLAVLLSTGELTAKEENSLKGFIEGLYKTSAKQQKPGSSTISAYGANYAIESLASIIKPSQVKLIEEIRGYTRHTGSTQDLHQLSSDLAQHMAVGVYAYTQKGLPYHQDGLNTLAQTGAINIQVDFTRPAQAAAAINDKIKADTRGRISELLTAGDINPNMALGLLNTLFVKTAWSDTFEESELQFKIGATTQPVKALSGNARVTSLETLDATIFNITTEKNTFSLIIKLPKENQSPLPISVEDMNKFVQEGEMIQASLEVPFVTLESTIDLHDKLKPGLPTLLGNGSFATTLVDQEMAVATFKQKVRVQWDNKGFEGAAATFIGMVLSALPVQEPKKIIVNRPFSFVFVYNRNHEQLPVPIFSGQISDFTVLAPVGRK